MNKTRPKQLSFRVSEEEYQQLQEKISESGKNQQEYILSCVLEKQIVNMDGIKELIPELKRIGNNLNQIAKRCNEGGMLPSEAEVFIVNSVNYENGHKLQWSKHDLKDLKERCNEQSREQGLHVPEKGKTFAGEVREETVAWSKDTYQLLKQAEQGKVKSYVQDIALAVLDCKKTATSRETFIRLMNEKRVRSGLAGQPQVHHIYRLSQGTGRRKGL